MTLKDVSRGSGLPTWAIFIPILIISIYLISGRGSNLIAGYNTADKEKKEKYDAKKLCRVVGIGMLVISLLVLAMGVLESVLPASFAYVALGIILADAVAMVVLTNTICKK